MSQPRPSLEVMSMALGLVWLSSMHKVKEWGCQFAGR
jgi:hypothetical protein